MPSRVLLIRPGGVGDCVLCLPAMERLRSQYTEVWTAPRNVPLIRFADHVDSIPRTGLDLLGIPGVTPPAGLVDRLRGFDRIVSWYGSNRPEFRKAVAELPFEFFPALPPQDSSTHAADFFLAQAGLEGPATPRIECRVEKSDFAVIHPFSGSARKNWPLERFREVAAELQKRMPLRWCAGPEEPLPDAVRFEDLWELARWLASACLYIGNDSGISHLAAAVGTPVAAVFVSTDPRVWAPRGRVRIAPPDVTVPDILTLVNSLLCEDRV